MKKLLTLIAFLGAFVANVSAAGDMKPIGWAEEYFPGATSGQPIVAKKAVNPYAGKNINTYLIGEHVSVKDAEAKLKAAGFEIIANYNFVKKGTTIIFTDAALKAEAAKSGRSNIAVLRLFVDDKEKMISITNPIYFGKAFMQDDYKQEVFVAELDKINKAFPGLKPSKDVWEYEGLAGYHFMISMPYYEDVDVVGEGTNEELLKKARTYKKGKGLIFELKLSDDTTLLGYALSKRTSKFVKKIGRANAAILPFCITISNGKATALSAKYYIAISYPLLDMNGFMGIMTIPGAVIKDYEKVFK